MCSHRRVPIHVEGGAGHVPQHTNTGRELKAGFGAIVREGLCYGVAELQNDIRVTITVINDLKSFGIHEESRIP